MNAEARVSSVRDPTTRSRLARALIGDARPCNIATFRRDLAQTETSDKAAQVQSERNHGKHQRLALEWKQHQRPAKAFSPHWSFSRAERSLHRIFPCVSIYLAEDFCLLVKRIYLLFHKLRLNFDDVLEILGLAEFLHERNSSSNALRCIPQKYSI
jgi:hypothetical protein